MTLTVQCRIGSPCSRGKPCLESREISEGRKRVRAQHCNHHESSECNLSVQLGEGRAIPSAHSAQRTEAAGILKSFPMLTRGPVSGLGFSVGILSRLWDNRVVYIARLCRTHNNTSATTEPRAARILDRPGKARTCFASDVSKGMDTQFALWGLAAIPR